MNMAYCDKFVMCIIVNDTIIKDCGNSNTVELPFDTEYKIRLRNKHNKRAVCDLTIDGESVSGGGIIIPANGYVDIERSVDVPKKFKFVSVDSEESYDFGKNGEGYNKGLVKAVFYLEETYDINKLMLQQLPRKIYEYYPQISDLKQGDLHCRETPASYSVYKCTTQNQISDGMIKYGDVRRTGVTVEGGNSKQSFGHTYFARAMTPFATIQIRLKGKPCYASEDIVELESELNQLKELKELRELKEANKRRELQLEIEALKKELNLA